MEAYNRGLKGYWKRRAYQRLDGGGRRRSRAELNGGRRRRFWRIRVVPRLRFLARVASPKRFLARIRDAYVRMMLSFASSGAIANGYTGYGGAAVTGFGRPQLKEYDEKMIVEIYKSLVAQGPLMAANAVGGGGGDAGRTLQAARR
ncbi:uncharacterized protein LOC120110193 [Phoenix dactylifera]|uniref:Uncharacterized protein LOC103703354 n=1 Tax=Phoenix dactylifera TaxID=42345 RepID=A0A8B7BSH6_PHODC|nr:uncharacterized protein LOC103703354 [Phoenix dactylifera]XP_038980435.1 uncharacterized protein LOC120110193 [Phoenix dactylifera]